MLDIHIGHHWISHIGPLKVHMDTVVTAWLAMGLLLALAIYITRHLNRIPGKVQTVAEMALEFIEGLSVGQMGKEGYKHISLIGSLFLFILVANLMGQLPWRLLPLPGEFASPTNDLNVTLGLALIVSVYYIGAGLIKKKFAYFKHYFQPFWFIAPMNVLEDFTRPMALSLRLFINILAGEVLILVIGGLVPIFAAVPLMLFELFIAFIQAFVFAILAASYVSGAVSDEH